MPRFNPFTGEALCGVAGGRPSVDGVYKGTVGDMSPTVWLDKDHILHQRLDAHLVKTHKTTNVQTIVDAAAVAELSAGCNGTYLMWGSTGLVGAKILPLGGLNRVITDARGANAPDGTIAYIPNRQQAGPTILKKGSEEVHLPDMYGLHIMKWGQAVWNSPTTAGVLDFWGTTCAYIPGAQYAKVAKLGSDLWILYDLPDVGVIVHKALNPTAYHLITAGLAYHPDMIAYGGKLAVCYATTAGEAPETLVKVMDVIGTIPTTPITEDMGIVPGGATVGPAVPDTTELAKEVKFEGKLPQFADLKIPLAQSKVTDNAVYQVIEALIERTGQSQAVVAKRLEQVKEAGSRIATALEDRTSQGSIHTKFDDRLILPNSIQLLAGTNITFDDSVAGKRTISATGGGGGGSEIPPGYYTPLTDGDLDETDLIFAAGECVMVFVPTP